MTLADDIQDVADELADLRRQQTMSERADADGRVTDRAEWRLSIDRRAEEIRVLERRLAELEREAQEEDAA